MRFVALFAIAALGMPAIAVAQRAGAPDEPNLESAARFRNITSTGTTKPPGRSEATREPGGTDEILKRDRDAAEKIESGICIGCK